MAVRSQATEPRVQTEFSCIRHLLLEGSVATRLDKTIKRELELGGQLYTVSMSQEGVRIVPKGKRKGHEISWETLLSGDAELRRDLNMSLDVFDALRESGTDER
jgi:hypothetical protein